MPRKNRTTKRPDTRKMKLTNEYLDFSGHFIVREWIDRRGHKVVTKHPVREKESA